MKVYKKTWPDNCYWHIMYSQLSKSNNVKLYGIKYWNGEIEHRKVAKIPGIRKRGIWQFDINDALHFTEDEILEFQNSQLKAENIEDTKEEEEVAKEEEVSQAEDKEEKSEE